MTEYKTSLYVAKIDLLSIPSRVNVRKGVWEALKDRELSESIKFLENTQNIVYNNTLISFRVRELSEEGIYLLSFFPCGENTSLWRKKQNIKATQDTLNFCDLIGDQLSIIVEEGIIQFSRQYLRDKETIDISDWEISFMAIDPPEKEKLSDFLQKIGETRYDYVFKKVPKGKSFFIFTQSYLKDREIIEILKIFLKRFGEIKGPKSLITAREFGEKFSGKADTAFIFVEKSGMLEAWYRTLKVFFDSQRIATQYIVDNTITQKITSLPGVKANLILEIMTKLGLQPIVLRPPEEIIDSDGFLCLSSIESTTRRLFGALFMYSKGGLKVEEEVQIYPDIEFHIREGSLEIPSDKVDVLSEKISKLIGKKMTIDIILTIEWNKESLDKLIKNLERDGIRTNRVYYVSSRTSRFVDSYLLDGHMRSNTHPFLKVGKKVVFLKSSTDIRIYANLSSLFVKLVWPNDEINIKDLKKILWLVKKRIYRIQEFFVLKIPEPIHVFKNVRNMYLGEFQEKLTIPLRLLI